MGSSLANLEHETSGDTLTLGARWTPADRFELELRGSWTDAEASLSPFDFDVPQTFLDTFPNSTYDFTGSHLSSDLAVTSWDVSLQAEVDLTSRFALLGSVRHLDYDDDAPYRYDTSGEVTFYGLSGRIAF